MLNAFLNRAKQMQNFCYFHRRRIGVNIMTVSMLSGMVFKFKNTENEVVRMACAGCLAHTLVETSFHMVDTVNIRSKANPSSGNTTMLSLVSKIWQKEGLLGFGRGFSAAFYGAVMSGFSYFFLYKLFKQKISQQFEQWKMDVDVGIIALMASFTAEIFTLMVQYPFDLVKCRLQSSNNVFKYKNLKHAFESEIRTNGLPSLYIGITPFLITYCSFIAMQFSIYEKIIDYKKKQMGMDAFRENELLINCRAGFVAGSLAAGITNSFESITVAKQTNPKTNIFEMIKQDGTKLLTRGLLSRIVYNGGQSFVFFNLLLLIGKIFNVELSD